MEKDKYKDKKVNKEIDGDEEENDMEETKNYKKKTMKESLETIFEGEELSDSFKENVSVLFEAALQDKIVTLREEIEQEISEELVENLDKYSSYVVENWIEENKIALQEAAKVEFAEKIVTKFREILEEVGVEIPEEKIDAHESLKKDYENLKVKLNESFENIQSLENEITLLKCEKVIDTVSEDLTVSQKEHFVSLVENIEFKDENSYKNQLNSIKTKFFVESKKQKDETQELNESVEQKKEEKKYVNPYAGKLV